MFLFFFIIEQNLGTQKSQIWSNGGMKNLDTLKREYELSNAVGFTFL